MEGALGEFGACHGSLWVTQQHTDSQSDVGVASLHVQMIAVWRFQQSMTEALTCVLIKLMTRVGGSLSILQARTPVPPAHSSTHSRLSSFSA